MQRKSIDAEDEGTIVIWGVQGEGSHGFPQHHAWRAIVSALPVLLEQRDEELALVER